MSAYDFYLRALPAYFGQTEAEYQRTQALLRSAIEIDPEYPEALGTLADSVATGTLQGWQGSWIGSLPVDRPCFGRGTGQ